MAEPAKFDMARRIAAALCYVGLAHLDRLTILPFGARPRRTRSSPGRGKGRIFRVFELLEQLEAGGPTDLRRVVQGVRVAAAADGADGHHLRLPRSPGLRGGPEDPAHARPRRLRRARHVASAIAIPATLGEVRFVDAETGERARHRSHAAARRRLRRGVERARRASSKHFCGRYDIGYVRADAERPFEEIVLKAFRQGRFLA